MTTPVRDLADTGISPRLRRWCRTASRITAASQGWRRPALLTAAGLAISAVALYIVIDAVDISATLELLRRTSLTVLAVAAGLVIVELALRSIRWSHLLPTADGHRVPSQRLMPVLLVGYLGNIILPARLGEAVRAVYVSRRERVRLSGALGSVVLERVLDLALLAVIAWLAAVVLRAPGWITIGTAFVAIVGVAISGLLVATDTGRLARWPLSRGQQGC